MSAEATYEEFHWSAELRSTASQLRSRAQGTWDTSNTRIIAAAVPPNKPTGPRTMLIVLAVLRGLVLSAAAIAFFGHRPMGRPHL